MKTLRRVFLAVVVTCVMGLGIFAVTILPIANNGYAGDTGTVSISKSNQSPKSTMDITTTSGVTYSNCVVSRVEPDGITFVHKRGIAKIPFPELPAEWSAKYGYDPTKANDYTQEIANRRSAYAQQQQKEEVESQKKNEQLAREQESQSQNKQSQGNVYGICPKCGAALVRIDTSNGYSVGAGEFSKILPTSYTYCPNCGWHR